MQSHIWYLAETKKYNEDGEKMEDYLIRQKEIIEKFISNLKIPTQLKE